MKKGWLKTVSLIVITLSILLTLGFIIGSSVVDRAGSDEQASGVVEAIQGVFGQLFDDYTIRKIAHFAEFCLLAFEIGVLFSILKICDLKAFFAMLFIGLAVAVADETVQNFTGRASSVIDVLVDFGGYLFGTLVVSAFWGISFLKTKKVKGRKYNENI